MCPAYSEVKFKFKLTYSGGSLLFVSGLINQSLNLGLIRLGVHLIQRQNIRTGNRAEIKDKSSGLLFPAAHQ